MTTTFPTHNTSTNRGFPQPPASATQTAFTLAQAEPAKQTICPVDNTELKARIQDVLDHAATHKNGSNINQEKTKKSLISLQTEINKASANPDCSTNDELKLIKKELDETLVNISEAEKKNDAGIPGLIKRNAYAAGFILAFIVNFITGAAIGALYALYENYIKKNSN